MAWLDHCQTMQDLGIPTKRVMVQIAENGPVATAKRSLDRRRTSEGFEPLAAMRRLDLSLEALILQPAFGGLFTDEEANFALEALMEAGYFA